MADLLEIRLQRASRISLFANYVPPLGKKKKVVPVLVDGAAMPYPQDLPEAIRSFHYQAAVSVESGDLPASISKAFDPAKEVSYVHKLGSRWTWTYISFSLVAYYFCAVHTHIIGLAEYEEPAWLGMIKVWSALYIWPVFFLPFVLTAIFRPLTILLEFATSVPRFGDAITYLTPLLFGSVIAAFGVSIELVNSEQLPWTIHPMLPPPGSMKAPSLRLRFSRICPPMINQTI